MRRFLTCVAIALGLVAASAAPSLASKLIAKVSLSTQTMTVIENGNVVHFWKVSTAREGKVTPTGTWTAKRLKRFHRSTRYGWTPMPYSIFYSGNFAIHGTKSFSKLGSPASAGCIRLSLGNAATLFSMAKRTGLKNMQVVVEY